MQEFSSKLREVEDEYGISQSEYANRLGRLVADLQD